MTSEQHAAAEALADAVERTRVALNGPSLDFGRALYSMFASLNAYRQAGAEQSEAAPVAPKRRRRKGA